MKGLILVVLAGLAGCQMASAGEFKYYDESEWPEGFDMGHKPPAPPYMGDHKIQIHAASWHWNRSKGYNETNKGIGYLYEGQNTVFALGGYENSLYQETYYMGAGIRDGGLRMMIGFATGYSDSGKPSPVPMIQYNRGPVVISLMMDAIGFGLEF
jgi:hypothetical protein